MTLIDTLIENNKRFSKEEFASGLKMLPAQKTMIIGCVDPRVDPETLFGLQLGDAAVIRNVGGRVYPATLQTLNVLRVVSRTLGQEVGVGWNIIVVHHTKCGIVNCFKHSPGLIAKSFGVGESELAKFAVDDPHKAVAFDVNSMVSNPNLPVGAVVTGFVYDVDTGLVEKIVGPSVVGA